MPFQSIFSSKTSEKAGKDQNFSTRFKNEGKSQLFDCF